MDPKAFFLKHWIKEAAATGKIIARIPEGATYRPDPKSRTAREIAWLMVREEVALADGLEKGAFTWEEVPAPPTVGEVQAEYKRRHDAVTQRLHAVPGARWEEHLPFIWGGQEVMRDAGYEMAWGFLLDQIHHRGQLSTYLRPMGAKVPAIYGPSADESS